MNALEYILAKYQLPKYKKVSNRAVLKALVSTLKTKELKELQKKLKRTSSRWDVGFDLYNEAEKVLGSNKPKKNETISRLLKQFTDKKSGKVASSRVKLKDRFAQQDFLSQRNIIKAFLMGSKLDREWAYGRLKCNWDNFFSDDIKALWEQYHDTECELIVIRFLPIDYILENLSLLDSDENYSWLCTRLIKHPQFQFDRNRLSNCPHIFWSGEIEYLYILAKSKSHIENGEATRILYESIATTINNHEKVPGDVTTLSDQYSPKRKFDLVGVVDGFIPSTKWLQSVQRVLWCMGKLGLVDELIAFEEWDKGVQYKFFQTWQSENYFFYYSAQECYDLFRMIVAECIPDRYKYLIPISYGMQKQEVWKSKETIFDPKKNPAIAMTMEEFDMEMVENLNPSKYAFEDEEPPF